MSGTSAPQVLNLVATGTILGRMEGSLTNDAHCVDLSGGWGTGHELSYSNFPYTVPTGKKVLVSEYHLVNKFREDPWSKRTVYVVYYHGYSLSAHCPLYHPSPPHVLVAGTVIDGTIMNGQQETQNMVVILRGWIVDENVPLRCEWVDG